MKKFNLFKKSVAITLAISLSTSSIIYAEDFSESSHSNFTSSSAVAVSEVSTIDSAINKSLSYYDSTSKNVLTNYADTLAILSSNGTLDGYTLPDVSTLTLDEYTKVSSLSSRIILLNTIGQNPRNTLNNRNLVSELLTEKDSSGKFGSYINSHIYAMIALYTSSEPFDVEEAINVLNDYYKGTTNDYGGTKLANSFGDCDTTALALTALAPFKDLDSAKVLIDSGLTYLENEQLNDGGFPYDSTSEWFFGTSNSNSTGTVVSGLIAIGEDVTSSKWTKNEKTPIDCLLTYQNTDGGFFYEQGYNNDAFSFNQCLTALGDYKYNKSVYNRIINTNYKITKSDLLKEINKADALNESNYTIESFNEVKTNLANANVVYNNAESTDSDIYLATSLLRYSMLNLVKTTDNSKPSNTIKVSQTIKTSNGTFILTNQSYEVPDNSTVYDVLKTSLNLNNIPFTINGSGSNLYISSIGNYAEFAQGANSGFEYYVNGIKKTVSSAVCPLNSGDEIEWIYTTDYTTSETGTSTLDPVITPVETATTISAEVEKKQLDLSKVNVILEHVYNRYINKDELSSFEQIFLKLYTGNNNQIIINNIVTSVTECEGQYSKPTDLAKTCLALNFYEQDIHNINGIDLYDTLKNYDNLGKQGVNGYIYALFIASNENDTEFCDELIKNILSYQNADGGFSLAQNDTSDIDITAMALQALSFFDSEEVNASIENALQYIELGIQSDISSESISQVIIALSLLDIDVNNARFTVYSENLVDRLLTFKYDNSSFYHTKDEKFSDDISTEQAVLALVLLKNNYENTSDEEFISIFEKNDSELLSRLDFITLLNDIFAETNDEINENVFSDLSDDALTTFTVNHFNKLGVVKGINIDNSLYFKPDDFITKQDLAVYLTRYKTLPTIYRNVYPNDFDNLSSYSKDNVIEFLEFYNDLDSNGNFNPNDKVTFDYANTVLNSLVNFR